MVSNIHPKANSFAIIKDEAARKLLRSTPCSRALYDWLLRRMPAGKKQEVWAEEFEIYSGYSRSSVSRAIAKLTSLGLVEIVTEYSARVWKLIAFRDPKTNSAQSQTCASSVKNDLARSVLTETEGSNPCCESLSYKENIETNRPSLVSSESVSQEKKYDRTLPQAQPIQPVPLVNEAAIGEDHFSAAAAKIESAIAKPLTPALRKLALEATMQVIEDAIAALQEAKTRKSGVQDDVAYLVSAIRGEYKPRQVKAIVGSTLQSFGVWFDWARSKGIAFGSMGVDGGIQVYTIEGEKSFEEAVERFPMV